MEQKLLKKSILKMVLGLTLLIYAPTTVYGQCAVVLNESFDQAGLPNDWTGSEKLGITTVKDGYLLLNRANILGSVTDPQASYTIPNTLSNDYDVSFTFEASRNTINNRLDFTDASGNTLISIRVMQSDNSSDGDGVSREVVYAVNTDGSSPISFPIDNNLVTSNFDKDITYTFNLSFQSDQTVDISVTKGGNAPDVTTDIALPASAGVLKKIDFNFTYAFANPTEIKIDDFAITDNITAANSVSYDFSNTLPKNWVESNTTNRVYLSDGDLVMERKTESNTTLSPMLDYNVPVTLGDNYEINFSFISSKNTFQNRIDFITASDKYLLSLRLGHRSNITYGRNTNGNSSNTFPPEQTLLDDTIVKDELYCISVKFKAGNLVDIYVDGEQKVTDLDIHNTTEKVSQVHFDFNSAFDDEGFVYFENFEIFNGDRNNTSLAQKEIENFRNFTQYQVTVGDSNGQYPTSEYDNTVTTINNLIAIIEDCNSTANEIAQATADITNAFDNFRQTKNYQTTNIAVNVDASNVLIEKKNSWFGANNTYDNAGGDIWDLNLTNSSSVLEFDGDMRPEIHDLANYTGLNNFRFPGGSITNLYKWKRAIGPQADRIDNISGNTRGPHDNVFGPDELGHLLKTSSINKSLVVIPFQYETPESAADFVEYMNAEVGVNPNGGTDWAAVRAANGSVEPYNIKTWEIGNELFGGWELSCFGYPSDGDDVRGGDNVSAVPASNYVLGGSKAFTNQLAARISTWKDDINTTSDPNQEFYVKFPPADLTQMFNLRINGQTWTRVSDFTSSSSTDNHYVVDGPTGKITFGDGINGAIPPSGFSIELDYTSGPHSGFPAYYNAMKAVDPSITILSCYEKEAFYDQMAQISAPFDGVVAHLYPSITTDEGEDTFYKSSIQKTLRGFTNKIEDHNMYLANYPNSALTGLDPKVHLTEYTIGRSATSFALFSMIMHQVINNYSDDIDDLLIHSYFKQDNTRVIETSENYLTPRGDAAYIFTHLHQDEFVNVTHNAGTYSQGGDDVPKTFPTASISDDNRVLTLVIPNTTADENLNTTITINNYPFDNDDDVVLKKWVVRHDEITSLLIQSDIILQEKLKLLKEPTILTTSSSFTDVISPIGLTVYQWTLKDRTDLTDIAETVDSGNYIENASLNNGADLKINGIIYEKGFSITDNASVSFPVNSTATKLYAHIGLDDEYTTGVTEVKIFNDNVEVYSKTFESNTPEDQIEIDLTNINSLKIETSSISGSSGNVVFGNPLLDVIDGVLNSEEFDVENIHFVNPIDNMLSMRLPSSETGTLQLYSITGRLVLESKLDNQQAINIPVSNLNTGIYIMKLKTDNFSFAAKVVKK